MRIVKLGDRIGVDLEDILAVVLLHTLELILIALLQGRGNLVLGLFSQLETKRLVFQVLAPAIIQFGLIAGPLPVFAAEYINLIDREVHGLNRAREVFENLLEPGFQSCLKAVENGVAGL